MEQGNKSELSNDKENGLDSCDGGWNAANAQGCDKKNLPNTSTLWLASLSSWSQILNKLCANQ